MIFPSSRGMNQPGSATGIGDSIVSKVSTWRGVATVPASQSQTHNSGRPVFSMPSHQCADQRGALSCPLTCSIGSRPLIAKNRARPTGAERGCARWSIGRSGCTSVRKQLYVCYGAVGEIGEYGEIREDISCQFPGRGTHPITPDPRGRVPFRRAWMPGHRGSQ